MACALSHVWGDLAQTSEGQLMIWAGSSWAAVGELHQAVKGLLHLQPTEKGPFNLSNNETSTSLKTVASLSAKLERRALTFPRNTFNGVILLFKWISVTVNLLERLSIFL